MFEPKKFVQKLLGLGDMEGLAELMKDSLGEKAIKDQEVTKKVVCFFVCSDIFFFFFFFFVFF